MTLDFQLTLENNAPALFKIAFLSLNNKILIKFINFLRLQCIPNDCILMSIQNDYVGPGLWQSISHCSLEGVCKTKWEENN